MHYIVFIRGLCSYSSMHYIIYMMYVWSRQGALWWGVAGRLGRRECSSQDLHLTGIQPAEDGKALLINCVQGDYGYYIVCHLGWRQLESRRRSVQYLHVAPWQHCQVHSLWQETNQLVKYLLYKFTWSFYIVPCEVHKYPSILVDLGFELWMVMEYHEHGSLLDYLLANKLSLQQVGTLVLPSLLLFNCNAVSFRHRPLCSQLLVVCITYMLIYRQVIKKSIATYSVL